MNTTLIIPTATFLSATKIEVLPFSVLDKDGALLPTIKHCFIEHMLISVKNPPPTLKAKNGMIYQAVYDSVIVDPVSKEENITVIVSFQGHTYGNFAVIRNLRLNKMAMSYVKNNKGADHE